MSGAKAISFLPRIRSDVGPRQWRYAFSIEESGVILLTAVLIVANAEGKALLSIKSQYTSMSNVSRDVMETRLVRRFFRHIGAL